MLADRGFYPPHGHTGQIAHAVHTAFTGADVSGVIVLALVLAAIGSTTLLVTAAARLWRRYN